MALPRPDGQMIFVGKTTFGHVAVVSANGLDTFGGYGDVRRACDGGREHDCLAQKP